MSRWSAAALDGGTTPTGRGEGAPPQLQHRAGVADRQRDRHRHRRRSHPLSGAAGNLYSRPTLIWTLDNRGGAQHRVEASYLASKLSWNADYVLTVARDDKAGRSRRLGDADNTSGTSFRNAKLQFVAGDLNRVRQMLAQTMAMDAWRRRQSATRRRMAQESFSDYHLYTLERKTSVNNNETKQVSMLNAHRLSGAEALRRRGAAVLLPQPAAPRRRRSRTSCRSSTS